MLYLPQIAYSAVFFYYKITKGSSLENKQACFFALFMSGLNFMLFHCHRCLKSQKKANAVICAIIQTTKIPRSIRKRGKIKWHKPRFY